MTESAVAELPVTLPWAGDETLYSWCCRWHRLTLNRTRRSGLVLFGVPSAAKVWVAPNPFGHFSAVTKGALGPSATIVRERTVVGSFLALARPAERQRIETGDLLPSYLLSAKTGVALSLRYCSRCAKHHQSTQGMTLWRVRHQLPGVVVCLEHGQPLVEQMKERQLWTVPGTGAVREINVTSPSELRILSLVAKAANHIFESVELDAEVLRERARSVVCEGYGVLDAKRLNPDIIDFDWRSSVLAQWCKRVFPGSRAFPSMWITDLLRSRRSERSPLRWAFLAAYFEDRSWLPSEALLDTVNRSRGDQLLLWGDAVDVPSRILHACTKSANANQAAKIIGVTAGTLRRWARTHPMLSIATAHWAARP